MNLHFFAAFTMYELNYTLLAHSSTLTEKLALIQQLTGIGLYRSFAVRSARKFCVNLFWKEIQVATSQLIKSFRLFFETRKPQGVSNPPCPGGLDQMHQDAPTLERKRTVLFAFPSFWKGISTIRNIWRRQDILMMLGNVPNLFN